MKISHALIFAALLAPTLAEAATAVSAGFSPTPVPPGTASTLTLTFTNSGNSASTIAEPAGLPITLPTNVTVGAAAITGDDCGFSGSAVTPGGTTISLGNAGTVPALGNCTFSLQVIAPSTASTASVLTINPGTFTSSDGSNPPSTPSTTTLTTSAYLPISIGIVPPPVTIAASDTVATASGTPASRTVTYTLTNPNAVAATAVAMTFPPLNTVVPGSMTTTCAGGSASSAGGQNVAIDLAGATIPGNGGSCTISYVNACIGNVNASSTNCAPYTGPGYAGEGFGVAAGILTSNEGITNLAASAALYAQWAALYGKTMTPASVANGDTVTMSLLVSSYFGPETNFSVDDIIPAGYIVNSITAVPGTGSLATNGADDASDVCNYVGPPLPYTSDGSQDFQFSGTLGGNAPTTTGPSTTICTYTVTLTASVLFDASGQGSVVKVLTNNLTSPVFTNAANGNPMSAFGNPATATVRVLKSNPVPASTIGVSLTYTDSQGVEHADDSGVIQSGGEGYFTFTYTNPTTFPLTDLGMTDTFTGFFSVVARAVDGSSAFLAASTNTCGGTLTATAGTQQIMLAGGSIPASGSCKLTVPVHSGGAGGYLSNTLGTCDVYGFDADPSVNGSICNTAITRVVNAGANPSLTATWAASNDTIRVGATTQLTLTYSKPAGVAPIYNGSFPYNLVESTAGLPTFNILGLVSTTCGNGLSMTGAGTDSVSFTQFATPDANGNYSVSPTQLIDPTAFAAQSCDIVLSVQQSNAATGTAQLGGLPPFSFSDTAANGEFTFNHANGGPTSLTVVNPTGVTVIKSFNPNPAPAGVVTVMTLVLDNSNGAVIDLNGITFTDNYPATLFNAATPNATLTAVPGNTCVGVGTGTLSAAPNGSSVSWSGGRMNGGDICQITVDVLPTSRNQTNVITADDLVSDEDVQAIPTSQSIAVTSSIGVIKTITPDTIYGGQTSTLKILLLNFFGNVTDAGSLSLTDSLASMTGVTATSAADVSGCGITATVINGGTAIQMVGGSIPSNGSCEVDVTLLGSTPGSYLNTINAGDLTANVAGLPTSNNAATSAPLAVVAPITLQKTIDGGPSVGVSGTFNFSADCTNPTATYTGSVTLADATSGSSTIPGVPAGSVCTVSETTPLPAAPTNYAYGATPAPVTLTTTTSGPNAAAFTNTLTQQTSTLTVTKAIIGAPSGGVSGTFAFSAACSNPTATYSASITLSAATSGASTITGVPAGSVCTVNESTALPSPPTNYQWGTLPPAVAVTTSVAGPNTAAFANTLTRQTSALVINKTVAGGPSSGMSGTFAFSAACTNPTATYTSSVTLANATSGSSTISGVPAGSVCTVNESTSLPSPPTNYQWGALPPPVAVTTSVAGPNTAAFTNTLTRQTSTLTVTKAIIGAPSGGVSGTFAFSAACTNPTATYSASVTLSAATSGVSTITSVPAGSVCNVNESTSLPTPPSDYQWGAPPPAVAVTTSVAGPNTAAFTNTLTQQTSALVINKTVSGGPSGGVSATFNFTATCTNPSATYAGSVPLSSAATGSTSITSIPAGSLCSVAENPALPASPANYDWGTLPAPVSVTMLPSGPNVANFINTLSRQTGNITLTKIVTGGPSGGVTGTFSFNADCGVDNVGGAPFSSNVSLANATTGTGTLGNVPSGASCAVTENSTLPTPPSGYAWGAVPAAVALVTAAGQANNASFTNTLTGTDPSFRLVKTVTGGPSALSGTFTFTADCGSAGIFVENVMLNNATSGSIAISNLPSGTACTFSESPTLPTAPSGYAWGAPPPAQNVTINGSDVTFTNTLTPTVPGIPTAVPLLRSWVIVLLGFLLFGVAAVRLSKRTEDSRP